MGQTSGRNTRAAKRADLSESRELNNQEKRKLRIAEILFLIYGMWSNEYREYRNPQSLRKVEGNITHFTKYNQKKIYKPKSIEEWLFLSTLLKSNLKNIKKVNNINDLIVEISLCGVCAQNFMTESRKNNEINNNHYGPKWRYIGSSGTFNFPNELEPQNALQSNVLDYRKKSEQFVDKIEYKHNKRSKNKGSKDTSFNLYDRIATRLPMRCNVSHFKKAFKNTTICRENIDKELSVLCGSLPAILLGETSRFDFSLALTLMFIESKMDNDGISELFGQTIKHPKHLNFKEAGYAGMHILSHKNATSDLEKMNHFWKDSEVSFLKAKKDGIFKPEKKSYMTIYNEDKIENWITEQKIIEYVTELEKNLVFKKSCDIVQAWIEKLGKSWFTRFRESMEPDYYFVKVEFEKILRKYGKKTL